MKRILFGVFAAAAVIGIFVLTLQSPGETTLLSEGLRLFLARLGIDIHYHILRSAAHVPMYFILGLVLILFARAMGWRMRTAVLTGCAIGVIDECLKIALPTREFDAVDLCLDFAGVLAAAAVVRAVTKKYKQ